MYYIKFISTYISSSRLEVWLKFRKTKIIVKSKQLCPDWVITVSRRESGWTHQLTNVQDLKKETLKYICTTYIFYKVNFLCNVFCFHVDVQFGVYVSYLYADLYNKKPPKDWLGIIRTSSLYVDVNPEPRFKKDSESFIRG